MEEVAGKEERQATSLEEGASPLRQLTLSDGISTIVALMVGSGIFSTAGNIQACVGSPGLALILWLLTGILALTGALCYAELGTMIPGSGGEAQYLMQGFGPLMTYVFNWTSIVILKPGTVAILSVATAEYMLMMISSLINPDIERAGLSDQVYGWVCKAIAIAVCLIVTLLSALSTKWSNRVQSILTLGKIGALGLVIFSGIYYIIFRDSSVIKANLGSPFAGTKFGFGSFAEAMNNGLWAFEGWNNLNIVAGDLVNPSVNLPMSIWISMVGVVTLYLMTIFGYYAVLPSAVVANTRTIGIEMGRVVFGHFGMVLMPILIAASTFGSSLSSMVTSAEIIVLAAKTGQMPKYYGKISPTFRTAARAYWMQGLLSCLLVFLSSFEILITVYSFPTWIFYGACVLVLLKMRYTHPQLPRPYKVWITTPILFIFSCAWLLVTSFIGMVIPVSISLGVVLLGIPMYYLSRRLLNAKEDKGGQPSMLEK